MLKSVWNKFKNNLKTLLKNLENHFKNWLKHFKNVLKTFKSVWKLVKKRVFNASNVFKRVLKNVKKTSNDIQINGLKYLKNNFQNS